MTRYGYFLSSEEYEPASRLEGAFEFFATEVLPRVREG